MARKNKLKKSELPSWHREALTNDPGRLVLMYEKAASFAFVPANLEYPFLTGGDYMGEYPTTPKDALEYFNTELQYPAWKQRVEWFEPFLLKVCNHEDFSLKALEPFIEKHNLTWR
jgi:hypothetical protein